MPWYRKRGADAPRMDLMGGGGYIPRFRNLDTREKRFHPRIRFRFRQRRHARRKICPAYGEALLKELTDLNGAAFNMTTMGTVLPRFEHFVGIDPNVKDAWGIPAAHITQRYTDNEYEMAKDAMNVAEETLPRRRIRDSLHALRDGSAGREYP